MKIVGLILLGSVATLIAGESRVQYVEPTLSDVREYADLSQKNFHKISIDFGSPQSIELNISSSYTSTPIKPVNLGKLQELTILLYWPSEEHAVDKAHGVNVISYMIKSPAIKDYILGSFAYYNTHLGGVEASKEKGCFTLFGLENSGPFTGMVKRTAFTMTFISKDAAEQDSAVNP